MTVASITRKAEAAHAAANTAHWTEMASRATALLTEIEDLDVAHGKAYRAAREGGGSKQYAAHLLGRLITARNQLVAVEATTARANSGGTGRRSSTNRR